MGIKIEEGKYYRTRDGRKVGPMRKWDSDSWTAAEKGDGLWDDDGSARFPAMEAVDSPTIIAEWTDTPKLWRDMTPEEKGALLLAHHEGKVIEWWTGGTNWRKADPEWEFECAYRIRPERKRETFKVVFWREDGDTELGYGTIDMIDGKPDTASIRMEEI